MNKGIVIGIILALVVVGIGIGISMPNEESKIINVEANEESERKNYRLDLTESVGISGP